KDEQEFREADLPQVGNVRRESSIHMKTFDSFRHANGLVDPLLLSRGVGWPVSAIAAQRFKQQVNHQALAMVRRRRVGKDQKLHIISPPTGARQRSSWSTRRTFPGGSYNPERACT